MKRRIYSMYSISCNWRSHLSREEGYWSDCHNYELFDWKNPGAEQGVSHSNLWFNLRHFLLLQRLECSRRRICTWTPVCTRDARTRSMQQPGRLRLRPWLEEQIQSGGYPGVSWLDQVDSYISPSSPHTRKQMQMYEHEWETLSRQQCNPWNTVLLYFIL